MARLTEEGIELRWRLCGHLRRLYEEHHFETRMDMAAKLGIDRGHFSNLYNGVTEIGLDVAWKMHRVFGESLNHLCDTAPPARFLPRRSLFLAQGARAPDRPRRASSDRQ
jgi:transcriptional regulator with XRE-family HTH domain